MRNRRHQEEPENHERWLVSYADFITLMFAFFVVLYATSTQNEEKEKQFEQSLRAEFRIASLIQGGMKALTRNFNEGEIDPLEIFSRKAKNNEELLEGVQKWMDEHLSENERKEVYSGVRYDEIGVRISLLSSALFVKETERLTPESLSVLDKISKMLSKTPYQIVVEGHAPPSKLAWEISSLRSAKIVRYFVDVRKMNPAKFSAVSFADQRPLLDDETETQKKLNDRIDILVIHQN